MGAGPDGGIWVLVDRPAVRDGDTGTSTVGLLDATGRHRPGWPIALTGWSCGDTNVPHPLAVAADGSIRLVCAPDPPTDGAGRHVALAFSPDGHALPGWPVELPPGEVVLPPVVVGDELRIIGREVASTEGSESPEQPAAWWLIGVAPTGEVRIGRRYEVKDAAGSFDVRLAADGIAYRLSVDGDGDSAKSAIEAIDFGGLRPGWPVTVDGLASHPVVGPDGRLVIIRQVGTGEGTRAQTMTIDPRGGEAAATIDGMEIDPLDDRTGAGAEVLPPLVAAGGATYVFGSGSSGLRIFVNPPITAGEVAPARLAMPLQTLGICDGQDQGCGVWRAVPAVGPDNTVFVPESAVGEGGGVVSSTGGTLVAISPEATIRDGWPVGLPDTMAGFWTVQARSDGTVDALAVVPTDGGNEWTLMTFGPDGRTLASTAIVAP